MGGRLDVQLWKILKDLQLGWSVSIHIQRPDSTTCYSSQTSNETIILSVCSKGKRELILFKTLQFLPTVHGLVNALDNKTLDKTNSDL